VVAVSLPPSAYLDRVFVDNMIYIPSALTWLCGQIGSDHVATGSDYPFDVGPRDPTEIVREAPNLTQDDRENILFRTAWKLLGAEVGARYVGG
jgi:aminocarboxymuconate-semialdehyde decarboxylase